MGQALRIGGLVLAAGEGRRFGGPKGLARCDDGTPWVALAVGMLQRAGCAEIVVALGAAADDVRALVPAPARTVVATHWQEGISATLRAGLHAIADVDAVVITPVDTPEAPEAAVTRVLGALQHGPGAVTGGLARAVYRGIPGHPVIVGRDHFAALAASVEGDRGARPYLAANGVIAVECADLWSGADHDHR